MFGVVSLCVRRVGPVADGTRCPLEAGTSGVTAAAQDSGLQPPPSTTSQWLPDYLVGFFVTYDNMCFM